MSKWSHLPNAKYIDRIIAHAKANPTAWAAWRVTYDAAQDAARGAARGAPWDALLALVAWDYAGDLMDLPAEQVKVLAILGDQSAILMYTAIAAMETTQELV